MKSKKMNILLLITNIILIGIICSLITKDMNLQKGQQIIKEMTETEYEDNITSLNTSHEDYANYIESTKKQMANAITEKGVETSEKENLETMVNNIKNIKNEITNITPLTTGTTTIDNVDIGDLILLMVDSGGGAECKLLSCTGADVIVNNWYNDIFTGNGYTYYHTVALLKATSTSISFTHNGATSYCKSFKLT